MNFREILANELANCEGNAKLMYGECFSNNLNPCTEWIKWLSYYCQCQKTKIDSLNCRKNKDLKKEELVEIKLYYYYDRLLKLFKIYGTNQITKEEYIEVYKFMVDNSLNVFMLANLKIEELNYAKEQMEFLSQLSKKELNKYEKNQQDNYENLSMSDAYILHKLMSTRFKKDTLKTDKDIKSQAAQNEIMRQKSFYNAYQNVLK